MVGFVRGETRRYNKQQKRNTDGKTLFPIYKQMDDEDCFELVKQGIGWYPAIYDIKDEAGNRVFKHNNCLPCKNMSAKEFADVGKYFPEYAQRAMDVAAQIPDAYVGTQRRSRSFQMRCLHTLCLITRSGQRLR